MSQLKILDFSEEAILTLEFCNILVNFELIVTTVKPKYAELECEFDSS